MSNRVHYLKVPEGCRRMSASVGLADEVILYFKLKSIRVDGYFKDGLGTYDITSKFGISDRTARRWISKLVDCGLMYQDGNGKGLISYNKLYKLIGLDITPNKRNSRLGRFKIFKINALDVNIVGTIATKEEIRLNQYRQVYMMKKKSKPMQIRTPDTIIGNLDGRSLSCNGLAKLLGYKSGSSAYKAELLLTENNLATVTKHLQVISVGLQSQTFKANGRYYLDNGILFKVMPNRININ